MQGTAGIEDLPSRRLGGIELEQARGWCPATKPPRTTSRMADHHRSESGSGTDDPASSADDPRVSGPPPSVGPEPSLEAILRPFPSGRARSGWIDGIRLYGTRTARAVLRQFPGRERLRPHPRLLSAAAQEVLRTFREPVCLETGCMRESGRGSESTVSLASVLRGQGRFFSLEEDEGRIESCRRICGGLNQWIRYVEGPPAPSIRRLREEGEVDRVHLAFLQFPDDPDGIWEAYSELEDLLVPGAVLVVDDAVRPGGRGGRVKAHLADRSEWDVRIVLAADGVLVAQRRN